MAHSISVRNYSSLVYANLRELDFVKNLGDCLQPIIDRLGQAITRNGLHQDLGVHLLHKHFNLYDDERLLRTRKQNTMTLAPTTKLPTGTLPSVWAFAKTQRDDSFGCYPVEFIESDDEVKRFEGVIKAIENNAIFLSECFEVLSVTGTASVLGLGLNVDLLIKVKERQRLIETDAKHLGTRALILQAVSEEDIPDGQPTQTLWLFKGAE